MPYLPTSYLEANAPRRRTVPRSSTAAGSSASESSASASTRRPGRSGRPELVSARWRHWHSRTSGSMWCWSWPSPSWEQSCCRCHPSLGEAERRWALECTGARLTVQQPEAERLCSAPYRGRLEPPPPDPDRVVEIALTSGTTGRPKLASLNGGLKQATVRSLHLPAGGQRGRSRADHHAGHAGNRRYVPLLSPPGSGPGHAARAARFSPELTLRTAAATASTLLVGVPTNVIRMLDSPELAAADLSAARCTAVAGSPDAAGGCPPLGDENRVARLRLLWLDGRGAGRGGIAWRPQEKRWTTVGMPHDQVQVRITSEGEICMRGPTVRESLLGGGEGALCRGRLGAHGRPWIPR